MKKELKKSVKKELDGVECIQVHEGLCNIMRASAVTGSGVNETMNQRVSSSSRLIHVMNGSTLKDPIVLDMCLTVFPSSAAAQSSCDLAGSTPQP